MEPQSSNNYGGLKSNGPMYRDTEVVSADIGGSIQIDGILDGTYRADDYGGIHE